MFGERVSPVSWAGPKRFHPPPLALADVPPIEGLVLSHDHYDHLDVPTIEALKDRVQRYFVPLGVGQRLRDWGVPADRIEEFDWWQTVDWPGVHMTPEETVQAFQELGALQLYLVYNSTFDLAFHTWKDPLERVAALAQQRKIDLATPEIGEVLTLGKTRENRLWWKGLR